MNKEKIEDENLEGVTPLQFCCPNCGSNAVASFEGAEGDWDHGLYHVYHREECMDCLTRFTTVLHPVWLEDVDVPKSPEEVARRRQEHVDSYKVHDASNLRSATKH